MWFFLNIKIIKQWFTEQIAFPLNKFNYNFLKDKIYPAFALNYREPFYVTIRLQLTTGCVLELVGAKEFKTTVLNDTISICC